MPALTPNDIRLAGWVVIEDPQTGLFQGRALVYPAETEFFASKNHLVLEMRKTLGIPPVYFDIPIH